MEEELMSMYELTALDNKEWISAQAGLGHEQY